MSKEEKKELSTMIVDFRKEMRAELRALEKSISYRSDTCDEVKEIGEDIKALRAEIKALRELRTEN